MCGALLIAHMHMHKEAVYSDPDIVLFKAPSKVWETDVELKEGRRWGRGEYEIRTSGLAALNAIVLLAPFSH